MKVWIDFSNSPHPLLFEPIVRHLEELGHEVRLTARDIAQTLELARQRWPDVQSFGAANPPGRLAPLAALTARARRLRRWAAATSPDVALSHNSYAQIAAARSLGIPAVTAMDYEYQPLNHAAFRLAQRVLLPSVVPLDVVRRQGATPRKVERYDGLKEELYVGDFVPRHDEVERVAPERDGRALVVLRAPATGAAYHRFENRLYRDVLARLSADPGVVCVLLARYPADRDVALRGNVVIPRTAVDGRSLTYYADLFVGAGGTMTREAAVLGTKTVSIFGGRAPAIDRWLERAGKLRRISTVDELGPISVHPRPRVSLETLRAHGRLLTERFAAATLAAGAAA